MSGEGAFWALEVGVREGAWVLVGEDPCLATSFSQVPVGLTRRLKVSLDSVHKNHTIRVCLKRSVGWGMGIQNGGLLLGTPHISPPNEIAVMVPTN